MVATRQTPRSGNAPDGSEASSSATPARKSTAEDDSQRAQKEKVLTKRRAAIVGSISDAVVAKDGEPFFLCQPDGQVPVDEGHGYGFYHHDCRFLDGFEVTIGGSRPESLGATDVKGTTILVELTNSELRAGNQTIAKDQLGITWTRRVDETGPVLHDEIAIRNFGRDAVSVPVRLRFAAAFEDVFLIRGLLDEPRGSQLRPRWSGSCLVFGYAGRDHVRRWTTIHVDPDPHDRDSNGCTIDVRIGARKATTVRIDIHLVERVAPGAPSMERREAPGSRPKSNQAREATGPATEPGDDTDDGAWIGGRGWATSVRTSSFALRAALGRSLDDLVQLRGELEGLRYYEAGVPWFATLFGRDALISAFQSLAFDPEIAAETLRLLASRQGRRTDAWRDEQPGKILHELRIGELARIGAIPHTPYYGTIDATPLFLMLLARHAAWTGSLDLFDELRPAVDAALGWLDEFADTDGDGFIDYRSTTDKGLVNQGWKDSGDGIVDSRGEIAEPPIALAEVQGYAYRAWTDIADLLARSGDADRAKALRDKAEGLRQRFEDRFWSDELGCYLLALANGRPCDVVASNAGQVLWTGIASAERAKTVSERLMRDDMYSGWGIRTLSSEAVAYHPIGYHLGTVWPHDNSLIAAGFRRYGLDGPAEEIFLGLLEATQNFPAERLPECFAGFGRARFGIPVRYPVACHPQAWAAGAIPYLLVSTLGLEPDGFAGELRIREPRLPRGIEAVELKNVPVGAGTAHLRFQLTDGGTDVEVVATTGDIRVTTAPRDPASMA